MKKVFRLKTDDGRRWTYNDETSEVTFHWNKSTCPPTPSAHTLGSLLGNPDFVEIPAEHVEASSDVLNPL